MSMTRPYCSVLDVIDDLEIDGTRAMDKALRFIYAASQVIDRRGKFIPLTETRTYDGTGTPTLWIDPLLSVTSLTYSGTVLNAADYVLLPHDRFWENGPCNAIELTNRGIWANTVPEIVTIAGVWGLYNDSFDLDVTATQDVNNTTSLTVSCGSLISPGCVLLLGSEQEIVEGYGAPTDLNIDLAANIDAAQADFNVTDGDVVTIGEILRVDTEQMRVVDISHDTLVTVRGWNGSTRATHDINTAVEAYRTFNVRRAVNGTTIADHNSTEVLRLIPPYDVRYLCEQITALMIKKAQGGFAGKTGNAELGEIFYNNEFPGDPIKQVMTGYRIVTI